MFPIQTPFPVYRPIIPTLACPRSKPPSLHNPLIAPISKNPNLTPLPITTASSDNNHSVYACTGMFAHNTRSASSKADHSGSTTHCIAYSEWRRLIYLYRWKCWLVLLVGLLRWCCGCLCRCCIVRGGEGGNEAWWECLSVWYVCSTCSDIESWYLMVCGVAIKSIWC